MKATFRVLSVGSEESIRTTYGALFGRPEYELITATKYRELFAIPAHEDIQIAVLNETLSREELVAVAQLIRWRWTPARILVVCSKVPPIDDALYDDRVVPGLPQELLFTAIARLADDHRRQLNRAIRLWEC
jgi:DNA-binding NtrC family response regulator